MLSLAVLSLASAPHPTLPTMWTATVKEFQVGVVHESEHFVSDKEVSDANPNAKWTNYTDGSCQRLIRQGSGAAMRYLLGCDAVTCCHESGDAPMEYQIPNVHPAIIAPVHNLGNTTIKLFNGDQVTATAYSWNFVIENTTAYVTMAPGAEFATLHRWFPSVQGVGYPNDYVNYTAIPKEDAAAFTRTFEEPSLCKGSVSCPAAHKQGKLTSKSLMFLRSGRMPQRQL